MQLRLFPSLLALYQTHTRLLIFYQKQILLSKIAKLLPDVFEPLRHAQVSLFAVVFVVELFILKM